MRIFKRKEIKEACCDIEFTDAKMQAAEAGKQTDGIKILGSGCAKCKALEESVKEVIAQQHLDIAVQHIKDFADIASYGVMTTPALVIHGRVVSYGKMLSIDEIKKLFSENGVAK